MTVAVFVGMIAVRPAAAGADDVFLDVRDVSAPVTPRDRRLEPGERNAWGLPVWGDEPARAMMQDAGFSDVAITYVDWGGDSARLVIGTKV